MLILCTTGRLVSDMLLSNMCEVFNGKIEKGRDRPVIGCLEYISPLTPTTIEILAARKIVASQYIARWNGETSIKLPELYRTSMWWIHAIATLNEMSKNPEAELDIYKWVRKVYFLETWKKAYSFKVEPIKGRSMCTKLNVPQI
uniref:Uncharacterized protein n=1 Tax=Lactuca sativa TaxID=4236 RepID=A0A9R1XP02_LACSA|nr:hypothetical protein LSAT_V11C200059890 [Lactuca sativa]